MLRAAATTWAWDAFAYAADAEYPLATLARFLIVHSGLASSLDLDLASLDRFLLAIDIAYAAPSVNPSVEIGVPRVLLPRGSGGTGGELKDATGFVGYHNVVHACDVTQSVYALLYLGGVCVALNDRQKLALLLAAVVHDVGHPGLDNEFLIATKSALAMRYHEDAPLERFHASATFACLRQPGHDFAPRWNAEEKRTLEETLRELVMATDMRAHFAHVDALRDATVRTMRPPPTPEPEVEESSEEESSEEEEEEEEGVGGDEDGEKPKGKSMMAMLGIEEEEPPPPELLCDPPGDLVRALRPLDAEDGGSRGVAFDARGGFDAREDPEGAATMRRALMVAALKAADLGHLTRPTETHRDWVEALQEEWCVQADRERAEPGIRRSNPGPAPGRDRDAMGEGTVAFGVEVGLPLFDALARAVPLAAHLAENARANLATWGWVEPEPEAEPEAEPEKGEEKGEGDDEPEPKPGPEGAQRVE